VMIFNINQSDIDRESQWLKWQYWVGPSVLVMILLAEVVWALQSHQTWSPSEVQLVDARAVGSLLFGPYLLAVEIASFLLLAGLVGGYHLAKSLPQRVVNKQGHKL
jgi:NADH-quinone oxidoreductase subunit J